MKNLKTAAVIVVLAMNITGVIVSLDYYANLFTSLSASFYSPIIGLQNVMFLLAEIMEVTLCFVFLLGSAAVRDKAYKLLRFYFVIYFLFHLPIIVLTVVEYGGNSASWQVLYTVGMRLVSLFCAIVFLMARPENPVAKIDLGDYEMVAYTSTGHRFVHRLIDGLFIIPIWLPWVEYFSRGQWYSSEVIFYTALISTYFLYYFVAEAIFRQTFGKIWTNSCVVSAGTALSTGRIFLRTLSRYIPFDPLSFLWKGNWHDSASSTSVVYVNTWENVFQEEAPGEQPAQNPG